MCDGTGMPILLLGGVATVVAGIATFLAERIYDRWRDRRDRREAFRRESFERRLDIAWQLYLRAVKHDHLCDLIDEQLLGTG